MARDLGVPVTDTGSYYFISYNSEDADRVKDIVKLMHQHNIPLWYDKGITYGKPWEEEIAVHIANCKAVILFMSKGIFQKTSSYVSIEYEMAKKYYARPIYVISLDNIDKRIIPPSMVAWHIEIERLQNIPHTFLSDKTRLMTEIGRMLGISIRTTSTSVSSTRKSFTKDISTDDLDRLFDFSIPPLDLGSDSYMNQTYSKENSTRNASSRISSTRKSFTSESSTRKTSMKDTSPIEWSGLKPRKSKKVDPYDYYYDGIFHYAKEEYTEAIKCYTEAANLGLAEAQYRLGYCYEFAVGVKEDIRMAIMWYRKAADQGHVDSQYSLGMLYDIGEKAPKDKKEAEKWYRKAAEQGDASALYRLSLFYLEGTVVLHSVAEHIKLLKESAAKGYDLAIMDLGYYYESGLYVEKNIETAKQIYRKALTQGPLAKKVGIEGLIRLGEKI